MATRKKPELHRFFYGHVLLAKGAEISSCPATSGSSVQARQWTPSPELGTPGTFQATLTWVINYRKLAKTVREYEIELTVSRRTARSHRNESLQQLRWAPSQKHFWCFAALHTLPRQGISAGRRRVKPTSLLLMIQPTIGYSVGDRWNGGIVLVCEISRNKSAHGQNKVIILDYVEIISYIYFPRKCVIKYWKIAMFLYVFRKNKHACSIRLIFSATPRSLPADCADWTPPLLSSMSRSSCKWSSPGNITQEFSRRFSCGWHHFIHNVV